MKKITGIASYIMSIICVIGAICYFIDGTQYFKDKE